MSEPTVNPITSDEPLEDNRPVVIRDALTDYIIWQDVFLPMPVTNGRQITLDMYIDGNRIQWLYYIQSIDRDSKTVFVTLNKVFINDTPISIP